MCLNDLHYKPNKLGYEIGGGGTHPIYVTKGLSININVHRNPNNVRKGEGGKGLVRILLLTKTLKCSTIQPCQHKLLSSVKSKSCVK